MNLLSPHLDTYVKVEVASTQSDVYSDSQKTTTKKKDVNPVFNEGFLFDLPTTHLDTMKLVLTVRDHIQFRADMDMGEVRLGSGNCCDKSGEGDWVLLMTDPGHEITGWHTLLEV